MKVLVAGIGGIGGWIAGTLARGGAEVTLYARGTTLDNLRAHGLRLRMDGGEESFRLPAVNAVEGLDVDVAILCAKTQDFPALCQGLAPLFRPGLEVIAAVNGLPWWFLEDSGLSLECVDPGGMAARLLRDVTPVGAVVHASAHAEQPGVIRPVKSYRLILGEAPRHSSKFISHLAAAFARGGVAAPVVADVRAEIWAKLWGNMNMNPVSALTRLTASPILDTPDLCALVRDMMQEFDAVGQRLGLVLPMGADERIDVTRTLGDFRTSMLMDTLAARRLEHEGVLGAFVELAEKLGVAIPTSRVVYTLLKGLNASFERRATS